MNSFEFNKIAGAVLGGLLLVIGLQNLAGIIYHADEPEKQGYAVEVAEATATGEPAAAPAEPTPIAVRLATADVARGQAAAKACISCHNVDKANANKVGPGLWDIIDKPMAAHEGYAYSDALKGKASMAWTYADLDSFIANPKAYAPGTKMGYAGMKDEGRRADLIAYLRSLSDAPKPLPAAQ